MLTLSTGERIETTDEHPFYAPGKGFLPAKLLALGTTIVTRAGPNVTVKSIEVKQQPAVVFNFEVDTFHSYFVGKSAIWAHNSCGGQGELFDDPGPGAPVVNGRATSNGYKTSVNGVPFEDGYPNFSGNYHPDLPDGVMIEYTGGRTGDFSAARKAAGMTIKSTEGYTWHHHQEVYLDGKGVVRGLMQLVKTSVHGRVPHTGGAARYTEITGIPYRK